MRVPSSFRVLAISSFLLAGCAGGNRSAQLKTTAPLASAVPNMASPAQQFLTIGDAVKKLLESNPQIIAFGEYHRRVARSSPSTVAVFARSILPILAIRGYNHVVAEFIPFGEDVDAEIASFNLTRELGPILSLWYSGHPDRPGIMEALTQAAKLGITLHGCHASDQEYLPNIARLRSVINQHALALARQLTARGEKVAFYNGFEHNSLSPLPEEEDASIGPQLETIAGGSYVEADIFFVEMIDGLSPGQQLEIFGEPGRGTSRRRASPDTSVWLFTRGPGNNEHTLIF